MHSLQPPPPGQQRYCGLQIVPSQQNQIGFIAKNEIPAKIPTMTTHKATRFFMALSPLVGRPADLP
jgi:hypothetical protein